MRRSLFLAIASGALLVATACSRSAAQSRVEGSPSRRNVFGEAVTPPQIGAAVQQPVEQPPGSHPEGTSGSRRKSWKDLAHAKSEGKNDKPSVTFSPWSAAGALAIVVALIFVLARLFRRHAPMFSQSLPKEALEILGRRMVDPRQAILLVRIGARILVVGSSANGLNSLGQIDDPVEVDLLAGLCRRGPEGGILGTSFFKLLKKEAGAGPSRMAVGASRSAARGAQRSSAEADLVEERPDLVEGRPPVLERLEPEPENLSQPEYDLMRRLRGAPVPFPAGQRGGAT